MKKTKLTAIDFQRLKSVRPIPMLTAYTAMVARCLEQANIPILLVGDTVAMVEMGFSSTRDMTVDLMCYHIGAVRRGAPNTHLIGDMSYGSDDTPATALTNAKRLLAAGADSIKLEGPKLDVITHLVNSGIDVVGHTGLTPQTAGSFKQVGRDSDSAQRIIDEANAIEKAGAFMLVLEHIPSDLGKSITKNLTIPTIGIGAGPDCDGQVLVINDAIGLSEIVPPFARQYAKVAEAIRQTAEDFSSQVTQGVF